MDRKILVRISAGFVLMAAVAGVAFFAFNAGAATHVQVTPSVRGSVPYAYPGYGVWRPSLFFGGGCFAPLIALFLAFVALRAMGFLFWGAGWRHGRRMHGGHWRTAWGDENGVPPMFQEWHDRSHAKAGSEK